MKLSAPCRAHEGHHCVTLLSHSHNLDPPPTKGGGTQTTEVTPLSPGPPQRCGPVSPALHPHAHPEDTRVSPPPTRGQQHRDEGGGDGSELEMGGGKRGGDNLGRGRRWHGPHICTPERTRTHGTHASPWVHRAHR